MPLCACGPSPYSSTQPKAESRKPKPKPKHNPAGAHRLMLVAMPRSEYVASIRERIGNELLLLPGVTAVIREGERFLVARHAHSDHWSLIGGAVEPGEEPAEAVVREVLEETGARVRIDGIVGAYGGRPLMVKYPNGDRVAYVTTAYECHLLDAPHPDEDELLELGWFTRTEILDLPRHEWIDRVIGDCP